jgi:nucleotide-binding universal stress UspA family protein
MRTLDAPHGRSRRANPRKERDMSYKTILVHVDESKHTPEQIKIAAMIATRCHAHMIGMAATALPGAFYLPGALGEGVTLTAYLEFLRERAEGALLVFEAVAQKTGVPSFEMRVIEDEAAAGISQYARCSDLVVVGQTDPEESLPAVRADFPEYVVMNSGRPVLIIPYGRQFADIGKRVIIAWDGGIEAARTVAGAIPLLKEADAVQVALFTTKSGHAMHGTQSGSDLLHHLARHGIQAEITSHMTSGVANGEALLAHASNFNADLMVMGGYGHSRFREVLLGGVTQTVLHSMHIPTLMSH